MGKIYKYGMRLRPFDLGCQPLQGILQIKDDPTGKYWNILYYGRQLTQKEFEQYELDYLGEVERL